MSEAAKQAIIDKLAPRVKLVTSMLNSGVKSIRYWNYSEADQLHADLVRYLELLQNAPNVPVETKEQKDALQKSIKECFLAVEEIASYMMNLYNTAFCASSQYITNPTFADDVDYAYQDYVNRVAKSVNNKQSHAPGFDGVGGGMARKG